MSEQKKVNMVEELKTEDDIHHYYQGEVSDGVVVLDTCLSPSELKKLQELTKEDFEDFWRDNGDQNQES